MVTWNFTATGTYYITTSWSGTSDYAGADSETLTVFVGPDSFVQFNGPYYNYIFGQVSIANYELLPLQGDNDFLSIPLGTAVSFSFDFTVLQAGQTVSNVQSETIKIPGTTRTETLPVDVPSDLQPLMLPDDFNQTVNNQFCFVLQNNDGNYSLNVNSLNSDEMSSIVQGSECTAFVNASQNIEENVWYSVTESVSDNGITASLYSTNGTLIQSTVAPYNAANMIETIMLITNNIDRAVVFNDLTVKAPIAPTQTPESKEKTTNENGLLLLYVSLTIILVATSTVALVYFKKHKPKTQRKIEGPIA